MSELPSSSRQTSQVDPWDQAPRSSSEMAAAEPDEPRRVRTTLRTLLHWQVLLFVVGAAFALWVGYSRPSPEAGLGSRYEAAVQARDAALKDMAEKRTTLQTRARRLQEAERLYTRLRRAMRETGSSAVVARQTPAGARPVSRWEVHRDHGRILLAIGQLRERAFRERAHEALWPERTGSYQDEYLAAQDAYTRAHAALAAVARPDEKHRFEILLGLAETAFRLEDDETAVRHLSQLERMIHSKESRSLTTERLGSGDGIRQIEQWGVTRAQRELMFKLAALSRERLARTTADPVRRDLLEQAAETHFRRFLEPGVSLPLRYQSLLQRGRLALRRAARAKPDEAHKLQQDALEMFAELARSPAGRASDLWALTEFEQSGEHLRDLAVYEQARALIALGRTTGQGEAVEVLEVALDQREAEGRDLREGLSGEMRLLKAHALLHAGLKARDDPSGASPADLQRANELLERSAAEIRRLLNEMKTDAVAAACRALDADRLYADYRRARASGAPQEDWLVRLEHATAAALKLNPPSQPSDWAPLVAANADPNAMAWPARERIRHAGRIRERLVELLRGWMDAPPGTSPIRTITEDERIATLEKGLRSRWQDRFGQAEKILAHLLRYAGPADFQLDRRQGMDWRARVFLERARLAESAWARAELRGDLDGAAQASRRARAAHRTRGAILSELARHVSTRGEQTRGALGLGEIHFRAAQAFTKTGDPGRAAIHYREARRYGQTQRAIAAGLGLGKAYLALGRYDEARDAFDQLVSVHEDYATEARPAELGAARADLRAGIQRNDTDRIVQAIGRLQSLQVRVTPDTLVWGESLFVLGEALFEHAVRLEPPGFDVAPEAREAALTTYARAVAALSEALRRFPPQRFAHTHDDFARFVQAEALPATYRLANALLALGRVDPAYLDRAAERFRQIEQSSFGAQAFPGGDPRERGRLARLAAYGRARALYKRALSERNPAGRRRRFEAALRAAEDAYNRYPGSGQAGHLSRLANRCRAEIGAAPNYEVARKAFSALFQQDVRQTPEAHSAAFWREQVEWTARQGSRQARRR